MDLTDSLCRTLLLTSRFEIASLLIFKPKTGRTGNSLLETIRSHFITGAVVYQKTLVGQVGARVTVEHAVTGAAVEDLCVFHPAHSELVSAGKCYILNIPYVIELSPT